MKLPAQNPAPALLAVSFGTAHPETRAETIGAVEQTLRAGFPDRTVYRAFTCPQIAAKIARQEGISTDLLEPALDRLIRQGVRDLTVQPTNVTAGYDYDQIRRTLEDRACRFDCLRLGRPLLDSDRDCDDLSRILVRRSTEIAAPGTALVWMGHGSSHPACRVYAAVQRFLDLRSDSVFVGAMAAEPDLEKVIGAVRRSGARRVVLLPLMICAGAHALSNMAGPGPDSWKSRFEDAGFSVSCRLEGLGAYDQVRQMILRHARRAEDLCRR